MAVSLVKKAKSKRLVLAGKIRGGKVTVLSVSPEHFDGQTVGWYTFDSVFPK